MTLQAIHNTLGLSLWDPQLCKVVLMVVVIDQDAHGGGGGTSYDMERSIMQH